eukprot:38786_1
MLLIMSSTGNFSTLFHALNDSPLLVYIEEAVALVSFVLLMILFWYTFVSFQNITSLLVSSRNLCLLSLLSFFAMAFISAMLINNLVTEHLTLGMCKIIYPLYFTFYNIGKVSIYCLLSLQQQVVFNLRLYSNILPISFAIFVPSILWSTLTVLGYPHIEILIVATGDIAYCYMRIFNNVFYAQIILALIGLFDTLFKITALMTFIYKSIAIKTYYSANLTNKKRATIVMLKLRKVMNKTFLCVVTSIICTILFLFGAAYAFQQLIFFLIIDAVICSCCTITLFNVGNKLYRQTCGHCEPFCVYLCGLDKCWHRTKRGALDYDVYELLVESEDNGNAQECKQQNNIDPNIPDATNSGVILNDTTKYYSTNTTTSTAMILKYSVQTTTEENESRNDNNRQKLLEVKEDEDLLLSVSEFL